MPTCWRPQNHLLLSAQTHLSSLCAQTLEHVSQTKAKHTFLHSGRLWLHKQGSSSRLPTECAAINKSYRTHVHRLPVSTHVYQLRVCSMTALLLSAGCLHRLSEGMRDGGLCCLLFLSAALHAVSPDERSMWSCESALRRHCVKQSHSK